MHENWGLWRPWDQTVSVANARAATTELSRSRAEREEVDTYLAQHLENRANALPA
jgi:hypothetical protein